MGARPHNAQRGYQPLGFQEGVVLALLAYGGGGAMAGDYEGFVGEGEEFVVEGMDDFFEGASGQVGAADASGEEGVSGLVGSAGFGACSLASASSTRFLKSP